ncbi:lytic transglycosylase domain-containing protein [Hansschlegelia beijingensis]|uniref:Soluble lytic murein transglycosylase-like protein n=1 Tax=Hansschlegelia beijingensis TaxID=1133344 RepID=A0A7W6D1D9_9HYPH|nr:soluble lytic murein transglycosylase-like protein [Hansschlegelia beijingensis]
MCLAAAQGADAQAVAPPEPAVTPPPAAASAEAPPAPPDAATLRKMVREQAVANALPPEVAEAVAEVESGFDPNAVGSVGEVGLMQVLPSTARMLGFQGPLPTLFDPAVNVRYGVRYLSQAWRKTGQDICATVMKYRAGHGETRYSQRSVDYCVRVRALLAERGFKVTGTVPVATFGFAAGPRRIAGVKRLPGGRVRMTFNWRQVDLRRRALDKQAASSLRIAD